MMHFAKFALAPALAASGLVLLASGVSAAESDPSEEQKLEQRKNELQEESQRLEMKVKLLTQDVESRKREVSTLEARLKELDVRIAALEPPAEPPAAPAPAEGTPPAEGEGAPPAESEGAAAPVPAPSKEALELQRERELLAAELARAKERLTSTEAELYRAREGATRARARYLEQQKKYVLQADELAAARRFRCMTALCWGGEGTEWGVEPVLDLPVGIAWSAGSGALSSYINANKLNIEFNAGLRVWMWYDKLSLLVYYADPVLGSDDRIRLAGSPFEHPTSSVRRPYPSFGIGLFGDVLQIGFAYDVLVNGNRDGDRDPRYRPNQELSRSLTITLGFTAVLTARTALAAGAFEKKRDAEAAKKKAE